VHGTSDLADTQTQNRADTGTQPVTVALPPADMRRKRPPALAFLLRWETLRQVLRVASLLLLDFFGVFAAIYVALMVKAVVLHGEWAWTASYDEARDTFAFAALVTVLLFARSGLYASRGERPGLSKIVSSLFQVMVVSLIFALVNGEEYSSYYIFYGTLAFAICFIGSLRWLYDKATGALLRAAGYRRRAVLVGSGRHIEDVAHALIDEVHSPVEMVGFISLEP
jgi:FlaA1/EpsC-like NDP-sugar epimerase